MTLLERDPPVDWKGLIRDLQRWGWKLNAVAFAINTAPSTLKKWWYEGSEPGYENGRALVKLHAAEKEKRFSDPNPRTAALQAVR